MWHGAQSRSNLALEERPASPAPSHFECHAVAPGTHIFRSTFGARWRRGLPLPLRPGWQPNDCPAGALQRRKQAPRQGHAIDIRRVAAVGASKISWGAGGRDSRMEKSCSHGRLVAAQGRYRTRVVWGKGGGEGAEDSASPTECAQAASGASTRACCGTTVRVVFSRSATKEGRARVSSRTTTLK